MIRDMGGEMDIAREISRILFVPFFLLPNSLLRKEFGNFECFGGRASRFPSLSLLACVYGKPVGRENQEREARLVF